MKLETLRLGDGPQGTVLLHGFLGMGRNLRTLAQAWSAAEPSRTFLLPDLTGHGASPPLPADADTFTLARDVLETVRAQGFDFPVECVGHSLGGRVSLACAGVEPHAFSRISLLDISPSPIDAATSESGAVLGRLRAAPERAADRREMRAALVGLGLSGPLSDWLLMNLMPDGVGGVRWRIEREALAGLHLRANGQDLWNVVDARRVPLRCIRGSRSPYVSDAEKTRLEQSGCPVATLEGAGHYVHTDAPEALLSWLRGP